MGNTSENSVMPTTDQTLNTLAPEFGSSTFRQPSSHQPSSSAYRMDPHSGVSSSIPSGGQSLSGRIAKRAAARQERARPAIDRAPRPSGHQPAEAPGIDGQATAERQAEARAAEARQAAQAEKAAQEARHAAETKRAEARRLATQRMAEAERSSGQDQHPNTAPVSTQQKAQGVPPAQALPWAAPLQPPRWSDEEEGELQRNAAAVATTNDYREYLAFARQVMVDEGERGILEMREIARRHTDLVGQENPENARRFEASIDQLAREVEGARARQPPRQDPDSNWEPGRGRDLDPSRHPDRAMGEVEDEFNAADRGAEYLVAREEFLRGLDALEGGRPRWFRDRAAALQDYNTAIVSVFELGEAMEGLTPDDPRRAELEAAFAEGISKLGPLAEIAGRYPLPAHLAGDPDLVGASVVSEDPSVAGALLDAGSLAVLKMPATTAGRMAAAILGMVNTGRGVLGAVNNAHATYEDRLAEYWRTTGVDPSDPAAVAQFATENAAFTRKAMLAATIDTYVNLAMDEGVGRVAGDTARALRREFGLDEFLESIVEKASSTFLAPGVDMMLDKD